MKCLTIILALMSTTVFSSELMSCSFGSFPTNHRLEVSADHWYGLNGALSVTVNGYTGSETWSLGNDPLQFRLNPSTCEMKILSKNNTASEFTVRVAVKSSFHGPFFDGTVSGSLFGSEPMPCRDTEDSSFVEAIENVCMRHSSLDAEIQFDSLTGLSELQNLDTSNISDTNNLKIIENASYPEFVGRVFGAIIE